MRIPQLHHQPAQAPQPLGHRHASDVFFDPTGRRWRVVKTSMLLLLMMLIAITAVSWGPIQQPPALAGDSWRPPAVSIPDDVDQIPQFGVGPLVRLVRIATQGSRSVAIDPATNEQIDTLTWNDADLIGGAPFAMQRYGYSSAAHKTIELTFDDGPDPTWTPKILDLLAKYKAPATFFVIGSEVVEFPSIVAREAREGHAIGNHTLTHPSVTPDNAQQQLVTTDRIIRSVTGVGTNLARLPYDGAGGAALDADIGPVMVTVASLGYILSTEEFDTNDWKYSDPATRPKTSIPLPPSNVDNITVLLHDGGGDRARTLTYLERLLPWGLAHGFTFHSLPEVSPQVKAGTTHIAPTLWDREANAMYSALYSWPNALIGILFLFAVASVFIGSGLNLALAVIRRIRCARRWDSHPYDATVPVSVVIAAYNEERVIWRTLEAIRRSYYPLIKEIIVVDDGSTDRTADVVSAMAQSEPRIRLLRQKNAGKAAALNKAFMHAQTSVIVTLDADTLFTPTTVGNLARHFVADTENKLGAVAGVVKVGNLRNLLTRWQALEYITMISVDRGAQDAMHGILVTPGACAAWSKQAVLRVGGYSRTTLAEDCDLSLDLQHAGYQVTQDDDAISYTEAPETVPALARQRFRWMYGILQALWKHRTMVFNPRYGWLGMLTLPLAAFSVAVPILFLPFVYVMAAVTFQSQGASLVLLYTGIFVGMQVLTAVVGTALAHESPVHLLMTPFYRLIYEPLRAYILYKSVLAILRGTRSSWNKLQRTGAAVAPAIEPAATHPRAKSFT